MNLVTGQTHLLDIVRIEAIDSTVGQVKLSVLHNAHIAQCFISLIFLRAPISEETTLECASPAIGRFLMKKIANLQIILEIVFRASNLSGYFRKVEH
jgi:hypothetical protein